MLLSSSLSSSLEKILSKTLVFDSSPLCLFIFLHYIRGKTEGASATLIRGRVISPTLQKSIVGMVKLVHSNGDADIKK